MNKNISINFLLTLQKNLKENASQFNVLSLIEKTILEMNASYDYCNPNVKMENLQSVLYKYTSDMQFASRVLYLYESFYKFNPIFNNLMNKAICDSLQTQYQK